MPEETEGQKMAREKLEELASMPLGDLFEVIQNETGILIDMDDAFQTSYDRQNARIDEEMDQETLFSYIGNALLLNSVLTKIVVAQGEVIRRLSCMYKDGK